MPFTIRPSRRFPCKPLYGTFQIVFITLLTLQMDKDAAIATVWDYGCEGSIRSLSDEQQDAETAHNDLESAKDDVESAKSMYELCSPSRYDDCDFDRMNLNNAIQIYNDALETLRTQLQDFEYAVRRFKGECLS